MDNWCLKLSFLAGWKGKADRKTNRVRQEDRQITCVNKD